VCGAVSGGVLAIGLLYGQDQAGEAMPEAYTKTAEFVRRFAEVNGAVRCIDIIGLDVSSEEGHREYFARNLKETCAGVVFSVSSIHQHETVEILRFVLFAQCLDEVIIVAGGLEYVDTACLHGRPCFFGKATGDSRNFSAFLAQDAGACQHDKRLIISVLEEFFLQLDQHIEVGHHLLASSLFVRGLNAKEDCPFVRIEVCPRLLRCGRVGRTTVPVFIGTPEHALESYPRGGNDSTRMDDFCIRRSLVNCPFAILL